MFQLTPIVVFLFIAAIINFIVTYISWQRREAKRGAYFTFGMLGVTLWTLAAGFGYAAVPIPLKVFFATIEAWGYLFALPFFTLFAVSFAGHDDWLEKRWVKFLFFFIPTTSILLVTTNSLHGWVWQSFIQSTGNIVIFEHGPGFVWVFVTSNLMALTIIANLWAASRRGSEISRRQGRLLLYAMLVPLAANLMYHFGVGGVKGVDWTSVTFSITGLLFLHALYGTRLLDLVPIAREKLVDSLPDGMIVLDVQNRIVDINLTAVNMTGLSPEKLVGKNLTEVLPLSNFLFEQAAEQEIKTELEIGSVDKRYFDVLISPLQENNKTLAGRLVIFRDITHRKENELRLLQLTQAVEQSPASVLITDVEGNVEYVNPRFTRLTGYTLPEVLGKKTSVVKSGQTPDEVYRDMWHTIKSGQTWQGEFLNKKKNGDLYWENAVIAPVLGHDGQIINFIAIKEDISKRKQIQFELKISEERFRQLIMSAPDAIFGVDTHGNIVFANHEAANLLGYEDNELHGRNVEILVPESLRDTHALHREDFFSNLRTRSMGTGLELKARRKDGSEIPVEINLSHSNTELGQLVIAYMRDITERTLAEIALRNANQQLGSQLREIESLQESLREQAIRDPLTQLHNRRFLDETVELEFHHADRFSETLSIILLDIDYFKEINDRYGHTAGDACLVTLANLLQQHCRRSDITCRYGGEEFILVLPNTNTEGAEQHAEELRHLVENEVFTVDEHEIKFTISLGISSYPAHGADYRQIINKADEALYVSKRTGRNRVTVWSEPNVS